MITVHQLVEHRLARADRGDAAPVPQLLL
jgi:hypothetical protein